MMTTEPPERLIGDKAYDSDELDARMDAEGVEMIAPHKRNRNPEHKTQDGQALRKYKRRWKVERIISWIQNCRRLCIRWEKSTKLFQRFNHLGCTLLLLKQVLDRF
jgi:transposase